MYTQFDDQQGPNFEPDGDYLDTQIRTGAFQSTAVADELSPAAQKVADAIGTMMDDNDAMQAALAEIPLTLAEAKAVLEENAPNHAFGLYAHHLGYAGLNFGMFRDITNECEIRVIPLDENRELVKGARQQVYKAEDWRSAIDACLSALFPRPEQAA